MKPITFSCAETLSLTPEDIAQQILDIANWSDFKGYGVLPGIKAAEFEVRTPGVVGTRIRVTNTDGSGHVEEIVEWEPDRHLRLDMKDFSPPLSCLATGFEETWEFERLGDGTRVVRAFKLHPKSVFARPALWLIAFTRTGTAHDDEAGEVWEWQMTRTHKPTLTKPTEGRTIAVVGDVYRFLATGEDTNGQYAA